MVEEIAGRVSMRSGLLAATGACIGSFAALLAFGLLTRGVAIACVSVFGLHAVLAAFPYSCVAYVVCATRLRSGGFVGGVALYALLLLSMSPVMFGSIALSGAGAVLLASAVWAIARRNSTAPSCVWRVSCAFWFGTLLYPATLAAGGWFGSYMASEFTLSTLLLFLVGVLFSSGGVWLAAKIPSNSSRRLAR